MLGHQVFRQTARAIGRVDPRASVLFICDIQERFRSLIHEMPTVIETARHLIQVCRELEVPCIATEQPPSNTHIQNPRVLLPSVSELELGVSTDHNAIPVFAKQKFSMWTHQVAQHMQSIPQHEIKSSEGEEMECIISRDTVFICGIEAHVCVLQTCLDLIQEGYQVHVIVDGVSSQRPLDRAVALTRLQQAGAFLTTSESLIFQMMKTADHPSFRKVSSLVKEHVKSEHQAFSGMQSL